MDRSSPGSGRDDVLHFVLLPGAGGQGWYWHRVEAELRARGYGVVSVDLPAEDDTAGLSEYADVIVEAADGFNDIVVVVQSMAAFSAPLVCARLPVRLLVLVNAMIPSPGETPRAWWEATGQPKARAELAANEGRDLGDEIDLRGDFFHDVPEEVVAEAMCRPSDQSERPFGDPFALDTWPAVPTRVLVGRDDRFFPAEFQGRVAKERLGLVADEVPGGTSLR